MGASLFWWTLPLLVRGCLLRWKPVEGTSTWERLPLRFPQKLVRPVRVPRTRSWINPEHGAGQASHAALTLKGTAAPAGRASQAHKDTASRRAASPLGASTACAPTNIND